MEEEPDNGGGAEEVTPRPKKELQNGDDVGPSQSPSLRRCSFTATSYTPSETSSIPTSSTTTSRSRRLLSDIAAHLEVSRPTIRVGPTVLTTPLQVKHIYTLLNGTQYLTQFVPNIPDLIAGLRTMDVFIPDPCLSQTVFTKAAYGGQDQGCDGVLAAHFVATALRIADLAQTAFNLEYNEANWYPVVCAVLSWPTYSDSDYLLTPPKPRPPFLTDIFEARDTPVSHEYLPKYAKNPSATISSVKVDHLILLDNRHPQIAVVRDQVLSEDFDRWFSPFADRRVARSFVVALVEVKAQGEIEQRARSGWRQQRCWNRSRG
ncbi:MAG: hypothetical protein M1840_000714 [Geoglossum simile]|nr:MAG: hypothetical protein M1840_000714 [Geoglossum simile]